MDVLEVRRRYDEEVRAHPPAQVGRTSEWVDGVLRHTVAYNFIDWWDFREERAFEIAAREAAFYRPLGDLKWKLYDHDGPANLARALAAAGLAAGPRETFMAFDLEASPEWPAPPPAVEVRRAESRAGVEDMLAVNAAAFDDKRAWSADALTARLADPVLSIYVAYADGRPVTSGRLELNPGTPFAGLYGGGTVPQARGRGVYRALVAARAAEARQRGYRWLICDARESSRPILQRLGFAPVVGLTPWRL